MADRTLSDADVAAIAEAVVPMLKRELIQDFYEDLGKGVWGLVWKAVVGLCMILAAWGAAGGAKHLLDK